MEGKESLTGSYNEYVYKWQVYMCYRLKLDMHQTI